jgi:DNA-binding SARP family transcriptional activator
MQDRSEFEQAARYLRRALRWEPLREDLHRQLVGTLLALGQRREAREQYRECLWLLKSELQADPLPETLQLEELIRRA